MKNVFYSTLVCFLFATIACGTYGDADPLKPIFQNLELNPGESYSFNGYKIELIGAPDESDWRDIRLTIAGAKCGLLTYDLKEMYVYVTGHRLSFSNLAPIYFEDTLVSFQIKTQSSDENRYSLSISAHSTSYPERLGATPNQLQLYVSDVRPLTIGDCTFSLEKMPQGDAETNARCRVNVANSKTGERWDLPVTEKFKKKVGRFNLEIAHSEWSAVTRTVTVNAQVEPDLSVRGAVAYFCGYGSSDSTTAETFFNSLGEKYGFEMQWDAYPGRPESVEYVKSIHLPLSMVNKEPGLKEQERTVRNFLNWFRKEQEEHIFSNNNGYPGQKVNDYRIPSEHALGIEWIDDAHLRVWAKNYPLVLDREAYYKRRDAIEEEFIRTHSIENRIYKIEGLQIETALALTQDELKTYQIAASQSDWQKDEEIHFSLIPVRENVVPDVKVMYYKNILLKEKVVADEKANVLIVDALPETHERIGAILSKTGAYLEAFSKKAIPKSYAVQILLLEGGKAQDGDIEPQARVEPERYGLSDKDMETFGFDALMELGKANVSLTAERGEVGKLQAKVGRSYYCQLEFLDYRKPYVLVKTGLYDAESERPILENTLFLEADKPSLLGVTNLKQALILIVRLQGN